MKVKSMARLALLWAFAGGSACAWANSYRIVDLGADTAAYGIDSKGEIAGVVGTKDGIGVRARVYSGGKWHFEPSDRQDSNAVAVSKGRVAGQLDGSEPVVWVHRSDPIPLTMPDGSNYGYVTGINSDGNVSGYYSPPGAEYFHCFVWWFATGQSEDLGSFNKGNRCEANGIDDRGRIYGYSAARPEHRWFAFVWHDGHMHRLPPLPPLMASSAADAGNKAGQVVGWSLWEISPGYYVRRAVLWSNDSVVAMGPAGGWETEAYAINDAGTIVGEGTELAGDGDPRHALRFDPSGWVYLENEVADRGDWDLESARSIAPDGTIVGYGTRSDGEGHAFMLIPQ